MALASSAADFGTINNNNKNKNNKNNHNRRPGQNRINLDNNETNSSMLNFYESMYHFKKMFPKLESDVIESVLRSNNGDVDKTIDQLLTIVEDVDRYDQTERRPSNASSTSLDTRPSSSIDTFAPNADQQQPILQPPMTSSSSHTLADPSTDDQPPSYNEIVFSTNRPDLSSTTHDTPTTSYNQNLIENSTLDFRSLPERSETFNNHSSLVSNNVIVTSPISISNNSSNNSASNSSENSQSVYRREYWSRAMISDLPRDFLRVRLTVDQIKKLKSNIKKAKRDEITAIVNNKTPQNPDLSFELKRKFNELTGNLNEQDEFYMDEWRSKYDDLLAKYKARQERAIQDEYIAKLIHNEEMLKRQQAVQALSFEDDFSKSLKLDSQDNSKLSASKKKLWTFDKKSKEQKPFDYGNQTPGTSMSAGFLTLNNDDNISIASNSTSISGKKDGSDEENSYNIDRIRELETNGYKTVGNSKKLLNNNMFKSIKSAFKRNSTINSTIANGFSSSKSKSSNDNLTHASSMSSAFGSSQMSDPFNLLDFNNNQLIKDPFGRVNNKSKGYSKLNTTDSNTDLIVFSNDYSYDDEKPIKFND